MKKSGAALSPPLVSTIIPVFNVSSYLHEAVESVLDQSYSPIELILVDDGSDAETRDVLKGYEEYATLIFQAHRGAAAARNRGIREARGDYLSFLDADDYWEPEKTEKQVHLLEKRPEISAVFSLVREFRSGLQESALPKSPSRSVKEGFFFSTFAVRSTVFRELGELDESFEAAEFIEWYSRFCRQGFRAEIIDSVLAHRRIHQRNHGVLRGSIYAREYARALRLNTQRLRATSRGSDGRKISGEVDSVDPMEPK